MAAALAAPLLPKKVAGEAPRGGASTSGAVFNLSTSIIGAGIMSIPATFKVLGVVPALLLICAVAFLAELSVDLLMRFTYAGGTSTYAGVMGESFGRVGSTALRICIFLNNMGCLIIYLIIIGDVLSGTHSGGSVHLGVVQEWLGVHWWTSRAFVLFVTVVCILLPLVSFKRVDSLRFTSAMSVLLAMVFVAVSSAMAVVAVFQRTIRMPRLFPDLSGDVSFFDLFTAVPVIVTAFTFHFNVHPIRAEMGISSDMTTAVRLSLLLCAVIYAAVGIAGYLLFGESTMADILVNFDQSSGAHISPAVNDAVRLSYALHLVLVFPLVNFSLRTNIYGLLLPGGRPLTSQPARFTMLTLAILGFTYLAAIVIPNIWSFFQLVGATSAVCISFIFPGLIVLRDKHGITSSKDRYLAILMVLLAVIASAIALSSDAVSLFKHK